VLRKPRHATGGGPARWAVTGVLLAGCVGALVWAVAFRSEPASLESQRKAAAAYRAGPIQTLIDEVGAMVVDEIKPSLPDLVYKKMAPEQFRLYASGWHARIDRARVKFDACPAPSRLRPAARLYDQSMRQYVQAVDAFAVASQRPTPEIEGAISASTRLADSADQTYDRADTLVTKELKRLGLPDRPPKSAAAGLRCGGT
jgi:hypothetical protein